MFYFKKEKEIMKSKKAENKEKSSKQKQRI